MSTLAETLEAHGLDSHSTRRILDMPESRAIKYFLAIDGNLLTAYGNHLLSVGFRKAENGIVAVLDGSDIRTVNGGSHKPRSRLQVMSFRALNGWMLWTPSGLSLVDESESEDLEIHQFKLKE